MATDAERAAMDRALEAARSHPRRTLPNPRVGCVILDHTGRQVGLGVHRGAGTAHAEVDALHHAGVDARGGTAVVTLEPCNHSGRTGPCSDALIAAGVTRVVYAQADPDPYAQGGARRLLDAGVDVEAGLRDAEARTLNEPWSIAVGRGRPFVTWKFAATLDGRSSAHDGSSRWITSAVARLDVHRLRAEADAVLVGTGTVLADDPRLSVRDGADEPAAFELQPLRVVVGLREIPGDAKVRDASAPFVQIRTRDVASVLARLHDHQIRHVWLEGGPRLAGAFVAAGAVDQVVAYIAPTLLGSGSPALQDAGVSTIADAIDLDLVDVTHLGPDVRLTARARTPATGED